MAEIIVYFSRKDENYVSGTIKKLDIGNTEVAAGFLQKLTGAELFKLEPMQEYSKNYNECIAQAQADQRRDARPELKTYPENLTQYDTIYLGYPNYWGTMPMAMFTFLEHFDFTGKTIFHSVPMRAAVWETARQILRGCVRGRRLEKDLH